MGRKPLHKGVKMLEGRATTSADNAKEPAALRHVRLPLAQGQREHDKTEVCDPGGPELVDNFHVSLPKHLSCLSL